MLHQLSRDHEENGGKSQNENVRLTMRVKHLACFAPAMLVLAYNEDRSQTAYLVEAENLMRTCMHMYQVTQTGLAAEQYDIKVGGERKEK
eukprot:753656-Hanusia_phi.AAC.1